MQFSVEQGVQIIGEPDKAKSFDFSRNDLRSIVLPIHKENKSFIKFDFCFLWTSELRPVRKYLPDKIPSREDGQTKITNKHLVSKSSWAIYLVKVPYFLIKDTLGTNRDTSYDDLDQTERCQ